MLPGEYTLTLEGKNKAEIEMCIRDRDIIVDPDEDIVPDEPDEPDNPDNPSGEQPTIKGDGRCV